MNLVHCPFCGTHYQSLWANYVHCAHCGASGPYCEGDQRVTYWNTRFPSSVPVQDAGGGPSLTAEISVEAGTNLPSRPPTPSDGPSDAHQVAGFPTLSTPQCSSGTSQSRPLPARPVKIMESAGHHEEKGACREASTESKAGDASHPDPLPRTEDKEATPGGTEPAGVTFKDQWGHTVVGFVNHLGVEEGFCAACDRMVRGKW